MLASKASAGCLLPRHIAKRIALLAGKSSTRARCEIAGLIPDLAPRKNHRLYDAVSAILTQALPLLAKLTRPAMLLPGPLQVVVKAQRIYLAEGEDYVGVWHQDGLRESIIAVVLYYYRTSSTLAGGALEFMARDTAARWSGDAGGPRLTSAEVAELVQNYPRCQVPVEEGTLVAFS